jgi:hypothetical protein
MLINCPHCGQMIEILEINCMIFRCGIMKQTFEQINPHSSKETCDYLKQNDLIFGCGKPFQFNGKLITICDYI